MWKPVFRLKPPLRPCNWLLGDSSRGFIKVNLFSSMNCFRAGTRAKYIKLKQRTPSLIGGKKKIQKAFTIAKTIKRSFSHQFEHNSRSRSQKPGDPRNEEVDFYLCSLSFVLHNTCLRLITRLASPLLLYERE